MKLYKDKSSIVTCGSLAFMLSNTSELIKVLENIKNWQYFSFSFLQVLLMIAIVLFFMKGYEWLSNYLAFKKTIKKIKDPNHKSKLEKLTTS